MAQSNVRHTGFEAKSGDHPGAAQVDRLAESMSGEHQRQPATEEARAAEKAWLGMFVLPAQDFDHFGGRIRQALSAIYEG